MIRLTALCLALWAGCAAAGPLPESQERLFLEFARDVSGSDPDVMRSVQALIATPPTTLEEIGFYGMQNAPAPERVIRGVIHQLGVAGHIIGVEDKYSYELADLLLEQELAALPTDREAFDILAKFDGVDWREPPDPAFWQDFRAWFPSHTLAIEAAVRKRGYELLSLNLPLGDTLHYWVATPEQAERWRGKALYVGVNSQRYAREPFVTITVTAPNWGNYWSFMTYALDIPEPFWQRPQGL